MKRKTLSNSNLDADTTSIKKNMVVPFFLLGVMRPRVSYKNMLQLQLIHIE